MHLDKSPPAMYDLAINISSKAAKRISTSGLAAQRAVEGDAPKVKAPTVHPDRMDLRAAGRTVFLIACAGVALRYQSSRFGPHGPDFH